MQLEIDIYLLTIGDIDHLDMAKTFGLSYGISGAGDNTWRRGATYVEFTPARDNKNNKTSNLPSATFYSFQGFKNMGFSW